MSGLRGWSVRVAAGAFLFSVNGYALIARKRPDLTVTDE
jgi:hypothetical protein